MNSFKVHTHTQGNNAPLSLALTNRRSWKSFKSCDVVQQNSAHSLVKRGRQKCCQKTAPSHMQRQHVARSTGSWTRWYWYCV